MSSGSSIAIRRENGRVHAVYNNADAGLRWAGQTLREHFNSQELAEQLIAKGSISRLRSRIEPDPNEQHNWANPVADVCVFYHRDRDEHWEHTHTAIFNSVDDWLSEHDYIYRYLFADGQWYLMDYGSLGLPLSHITILE